MKKSLVILLLTSPGLLAQVEQLSLQKQIYAARDRVLPALVHVEPIKKVYTRGEKQRTLVTGSGVIFSEEGYVMTNHHVAGNAEKVWCTLSNKERITASVVGSDQSTDIAVLKLHLEELSNNTIDYAILGDSDGLEVGQIVLALGSPLGLSRSVSMGVISSIDRYFADRGSMISPYNLWIQTDAAINPGNSGGPLINLAGEVIGINARAVFLAENLGFAIPINLAREVATEIIKGTTVKRAWIGIDFQEIKDYKEYLNLPELSGILVSHVEKNSPADEAGLVPGDVIQKIAGNEVDAEFEENLPAIRKIMASLAIDQRTAVDIWRNGNQETVYIVTVEEPLGDGPEFDATNWGMVVQRLSWHIYHMHMLEDFNGVFITSVKPGSPAGLSQLRNGDVVRKVNGVQILNTDDFRQFYETFKDASEPIYLELIRHGHPYFAVLNQSPTP